MTPYITVAFREELSETGYVEGRTIAIEYRWTNDQLIFLQRS
jgi:hypothetical protein